MSVYLDDRLDFREHFRKFFKMVNRTVSLLSKLQNILLRAPLVKNYKSFISLHLDYGNILYDQMFINFFHEKLEFMLHIVLINQLIETICIQNEIYFADKYFNCYFKNCFK